jgi:hypothetical protein
LTCPKDLYDRTTGVLERWARRRDRILAAVTRLAGRPEAPTRWGSLVKKMVAEAYRAGLRYWLQQVYKVAARPDVKTAEDLRRWCSLLFKVTNVVEEARVNSLWGRFDSDLDPDSGQLQHFFVEDFDDRWLLSELIVSFPDAVLEADYTGVYDYSRWADVGCSDPTFDDEWPSPHAAVDLTPVRCQRIADHARKLLRSLALPLSRPYPSLPAQVTDTRELQIALDAVMNWARVEIQRQQGPPATTRDESGKRATDAGSDAAVRSRNRLNTQIVNAAIRLLVVHKLSVSEIARKLNVRRSTLYSCKDFRDVYDKQRGDAEAYRQRRHRGYRTPDGRVEAEDSED